MALFNEVERVAESVDETVEEEVVATTKRQGKRKPRPPIIHVSLGWVLAVAPLAVWLNIHTSRPMTDGLISLSNFK